VRLSKRQVEALLAGLDDDPRAALTDALRIALGAPRMDFAGLIRLANFPPLRADALLSLTPAAVDELAAELNELRGLASR
jgi:hypothetical protein